MTILLSMYRKTFFKRIKFQIILGKIDWITRCTTNVYFLGFFSSLQNKEGRRKGECSSKTSFKPLFKRIQSIFTVILSYFLQNYFFKTYLSSEVNLL